MFLSCLGAPDKHFQFCHINTYTYKRNGQAYLSDTRNDAARKPILKILPIDLSTPLCLCSPYITSSSGFSTLRVSNLLDIVMNVTKDLILTPYFIRPNGTKFDATEMLQPYGYRTLFQIVKSCALTIFACTWATMHPNIPSKFRYRAHLWIVDLIIPELLLLWAAKQYFAAWSLVKSKCMFCPILPVPGLHKTVLPTARHGTENNSAGVEKEEPTRTFSLLSSSTACDERGKDTSDRTITQALLTLPMSFFKARDKGRKNTYDWTMTQAFFALMGGSQDEASHILSPYASRDRIKMPADEEILDKSKADIFVKLLALVQTLWFAFDTIYRMQSSKLYATEAEIVTFTFACLSAITKFFWWRKPQDINRPLPQYPNDPRDTPSQNPRAFTANVIPPNFIILAISMLQSDSGNTHNEFISESEIYSYSGVLSWGEMTIAVLCAGIFGSLTGICHLIAASIGGGLTTTRGRIWFSFALIGSALPFYLLLIIPISFVVKVVGGTEKGKAFLHHALNTPFGTVFLIISMIGRIALIVALISFMFIPYGYTTFLTPEWSQYIPHPF